MAARCPYCPRILLPLIAVAGTIVSTVLAVEVLPPPIQLPPSNVWDGNDGAWSSFALQIGSPPQSVRVLPSTTGNSVWTVVQSGCAEADGKDCPDSRGGLFAINASMTWEDEGLYALPLTPQNYLPYSGNGYYGLEDISLGGPDQADVQLEEQVVIGYAEMDFHVGSLGLSPESFNITDLYDSHSSVLGTLYEKHLIPSLSYGYSAGAHYNSYPKSSFASLVFGGFDNTRLDGDSNLTLAGGSDQYRSMLLGIESITTGDDSLLSEPVVGSLDSQVSQIWLPLDACQAFEEAFGLVWDEEYELYMINDTQRDDLLERDPTITFTLSTGFDNSPDRLNITFPYGAFDMMAKPPLAGPNEARYFPLKRAANETQITLGRVFFQEIYLLADYDRGRIMLFPALYPETSVEPDIIPLCPWTFADCRSPKKEDSKQLSKGQIVGVVVGVFAFVVIVGSIVLAMLRRRREAAARKDSQMEFAAPFSDAAELPDAKTSHASCTTASDHERIHSPSTLRSGTTSAISNAAELPDAKTASSSCTASDRGRVHSSTTKSASTVEPWSLNGETTHELPSGTCASELDGDVSPGRRHELPG